MEWLQLAATPEAKPYYFGASTAVADQVPQEANVTSTEGTWACHRGKTTGWSCGSLQNVQYKPVYTGACLNAAGASVACESRFVLVRGLNLNNAGGDSGGPWVRGSGLDEPLGVHKGGNASGDAWYSKLGNLPSNVSIWVA
jgi:streptogrisin C